MQFRLVGTCLDGLARLSSGVRKAIKREVGVSLDRGCATRRGPQDGLGGRRPDLHCQRRWEPSRAPGLGACLVRERAGTGAEAGSEPDTEPGSGRLGRP